MAFVSTCFDVNTFSLTASESRIRASVRRQYTCIPDSFRPLWADCRFVLVVVILWSVLQLLVARVLILLCAGLTEKGHGNYT
ncbi:MAG: hypothetical protein ACREBC_34955, partial [Pyrinomonadaceae bacterium]